MNELQAAIEAIIYAADEPATVAQIAAALEIEKGEVEAAIEQLQARYASDDVGVEVKAVAGGYRIGTKPQHHESVRKFIKNLKPPIRLSLAALETLAVVAYRQPITVPEIKEIRGVDPGGVINTLLDKKLITTAGRKEVVGKPFLYRTTRDFLVRFGLSGLNDLPTLREFEEMARAGMEGEELVPEEIGMRAQAPLLAAAAEPDTIAESSGTAVVAGPGGETDTGADPAEEPPPSGPADAGEEATVDGSSAAVAAPAEDPGEAAVPAPTGETSPDENATDPETDETAVTSSSH